MRPRGQRGVEDIVNEHGRAILKSFEEAQQKGASAQEQGFKRGPTMRERRTPGGRPVPREFDVGNFSHTYAEELIPESTMPRGLDPEVTIELPEQGSVRLDRVDWKQGIVYEVKPNTEASLAAGSGG